MYLAWTLLFEVASNVLQLMGFNVEEVPATWGCKRVNRNRPANMRVAVKKTMPPYSICQDVAKQPVQTHVVLTLLQQLAIQRCQPPLFSRVLHLDSSDRSITHKKTSGNTKFGEENALWGIILVTKGNGCPCCVFSGIQLLLGNMNGWNSHWQKNRSKNSFCHRVSFKLQAVGGEVQQTLSTVIWVHLAFRRYGI